MRVSNAWAKAPWEPRDWQADALRAAERTIGHCDPVIRAVTGAGKSGVIAELCWQFDGQVVVTTPSQSLVRDLSETIAEWGVYVGRYYADAKQTHPPVIVTCNDSVPSLSEKIPPPDLWICDEAHKSECDTMHDAILGPRGRDGARQPDKAWTPDARVGFTATPYRADDSESLRLFDTLAYDYGPAQAIQDGVVVPPRVQHYEGDKDNLNDICIELIQGAEGPGVVDSINISDAEEFAEMLRDSGVRAKAVHSKHHERTVDKRIANLESGELDCLVHVSLLSEGVDLPWLRWLCCRRPISSKTLFAQYIGRGLRTYEGKDHCVVYDPQNLFSQLSIDHEAILGGEIEDDEGLPEMEALEVDWAIEALEEALDGGAPQETLAEARAEAVDTTVSYIIRLRLAFQSQGLCSMKIENRDWREKEPTQRQLDYIQEWHWLVTEPEVPETHSRALRSAIRTVEHSDRGTASDLISILKVLQYGWPEEAVEGVAA